MLGKKQSKLNMLDTISQLIMLQEVFGGLKKCNLLKEKLIKLAQKSNFCNISQLHLLIQRRLFKPTYRDRL